MVFLSAWQLLRDSTPMRAWASHMSHTFPSKCQVCNGWGSRMVCGTCYPLFTPPAARCLRCARRLPEQSASQVCANCLQQPPIWQDCAALVDYAYPWSDAIVAFKFREQTAWAGFFGEKMRKNERIAQLVLQADSLLAIPLSKQRLQERGYNQSLMIAKQLDSKKTQAQVLLRLRNTQEQSHLHQRDRLDNVRGAFLVHPQHIANVRGKSVVLVDDVITSGATLHAATQALLLAGARLVNAIVVARA